MIIEEQKALAKWHYSNKEWFISKGYAFTNFGDEFEVNYIDLMVNSKVNIFLKCDNCSEEFKQKYCLAIKRVNHFCKNECYKNFRKNNVSLTNTQVEIKCDNCEKPIKVKKYRYEKLLNGEQSFITCSRTCQNILIGKEHRGENNINYKQPYSIICNICEKPFEVPPNRKDRAKYCSKQCQRIGVGKQNIPTKVRIIECDNCSKKVTRWEHQLMKYEYHFCSSECRQSYQGIFLSNRTNKLETSCQIKINKVLKVMNIEFENEKPYQFYAVDNFLIKSNLIIEVMGDYWHSNPTKYSSYGNLNDTQLTRVKIDKSKRTYIRNKHNINILYLWESDINKNPELCKSLIQLYINNAGILNDYNSYNYQIMNKVICCNDKIMNKVICCNDKIMNKVICCNDKIINPYFMKPNTKRQI